MEQIKINTGAIMRRVYYAYALSIVSHAMFWQGMFLSVAAYALAKWLHVASIVNNLLSVPVGGAPKYVYGSFANAISHGEFLTALTLVLAGVVTVSVGYKLANIVFPRLMYIHKLS